MRHCHVDSPIGRLLLTGRDGVLTGIYVADHERSRQIDPTSVEDPSAFVAAQVQLSEYFAGERIAFDLPIELDGTRFQQEVWAALQEIPYGETVGYGVLARRLGRPKASRAVGGANGRNPVSIVVPCHRVVAAGGGLGGYGWGPDRKTWLLEHERRVAAGHTET